MFGKSMVALVTPMKPTGDIDFDAYRSLIQWHLASGTSALIINGTTGEAPTLSIDEQDELFKVALSETKNQIPIIAGTGTNSTQATIRRCQQAQTIGVDACLVVAPYYNRPMQEGLFQHFTEIANNTALPIILYNVPGRTASDILPETVGRLAQHPRIIGIKEASGDISRVSAIQAITDTAFRLFSGDDISAFDFLKAGGNGVISVTANVKPKDMADFCEACEQSDYQEAERINQQLMPLHRALFVEPNPIPVKWALSILHKIDSGIRLPLTPLSAPSQIHVKEALEKSALLATA